MSLQIFRRKRERAVRANPFGRQIYVALLNGALLTAFLLYLRVEKISDQQLNLGWRDWCLALAPEVGFGAISAGVLILGARLLGARLARLWWIASAVFFVAIYIVSLSTHQFYIHAGTVLDARLVFYGLTHFNDLRDLLATGVDISFLVHLLLVTSVLMLGIASVASRKHVLASSGLFVSVGTVGLGAVLLSLPPPPQKQAHAVASHLARDLFPLSLDGISKEEAAIYEIYKLPTLSSFTTTQTPNILLIILESTPAHLMPPYRSNAIQSVTPFFDQFVKNAIVFDEVYTTVPHTSKALVGILCGMYPVLRMERYEVSPDFFSSRCLPDLLKPLGYRTAFMQSASEFEERGALLKNMGFDHWVTMQNLEAPQFQKTGYLGMDEYAMLESAVKWASEPRGKPFFLSILTVSTHHPYQVPGTPAVSQSLNPHAINEANHRKAMHYVDGFVEKMLIELEAVGAMENTVVIILGDHGEAFGQHGRYQHDIVPWEEGVRVPLYVKGLAWLGAPRSVGGLRSHLDVMPTILDFVGAQWTGVLPGRDLFKTDGHERIISVCWYTHKCIAMRTKKTKFVFHFGKMGPEAYDLARDPLEKQNLAGQLTPRELREAEAQAMSTYFSVNAYYKPIVEQRIAKDKSSAKAKSKLKKSP